MALVINHNMMAANVARNLNTSYNRLGKSTSRLSSGLRITQAADDAAGLAIREMMRSDIATFNQGIRNANDAISLIQVADGAMAVIDEKLIRMKELAEQASTGTYNSTQRLMIDSEYQQMASEITRIANATEFNSVKLLDGSLSGRHDGTGSHGDEGFGLDSIGELKIHFGIDNNSAEDYYYIQIGCVTASALGLGNESRGITSKPATLDDLKNFDTAFPGFPTNLTRPATVDDFKAFTDAFPDFTKQITRAATSADFKGFSDAFPNYAPNDPDWEKFIDAAATTPTTPYPGVATALNGAGHAATTTPTAAEWTAAKALSATDAEAVWNSWVTAQGAEHAQYVADFHPTISTTEWKEFIQAAENDTGTYPGVGAALNATSHAASTTPTNAEWTTAKNLSATDAEAVWNSWVANSSPELTTYFNANHAGEDIDSTAWKDFIRAAKKGTYAGVGGAIAAATQGVVADPTNVTDAEWTKAENLTSDQAQAVWDTWVGANPTEYEKYFNDNYAGKTIDTVGVGSAGYAVSTQSMAQHTMTAVNNAIVSKDKIRAHLGALQNRLENTITNLETMAENLQAAESRISDVDVATEMTEFIRNQILTQSGVAMLSQANSLPQMATQLLQG